MVMPLPQTLPSPAQTQGTTTPCTFGYTTAHGSPRQVKVPRFCAGASTSSSSYSKGAYLRAWVDLANAPWSLGEKQKHRQDLRKPKNNLLI